MLVGRAVTSHLLPQKLRCIWNKVKMFSQTLRQWKVSYLPPTVAYALSKTIVSLGKKILFNPWSVSQWSKAHSEITIPYYNHFMQLLFNTFQRNKMKWTLPSNDIFCIKASDSVIVHVCMRVHSHSYLALLRFNAPYPWLRFLSSKHQSMVYKTLYDLYFTEGEIKVGPWKSCHNEIRNYSGAFQLSNCVFINSLHSHFSP